MRILLPLIAIPPIFILMITSGCEKNKSPDASGSESARYENAIVYSCPMHHQVKSNHPGDCPICHMTLVKIKGVDEKKIESTANSEKKIKHYRNPMDPKVHSDVPMKDSMGMDYIPVYENDLSDRQSQKSPTTEAESFTLTPDQFSLSGSKIVRVTRGDLILELAVAGRALGGSRVSFQVFEQDAGIIKPGMEFDATSPSSPGITANGKITLIDSILDPMTRTLRVDGILINGGGITLKNEASVTGKIKVKKSGVLIIPEEAVLHSGSREIVYLYSGNGKFSARSVSLGIKGAGFYEVKSGIDMGDKISGGPNFLIDSEAKIESAQ